MTDTLRRGWLVTSFGPPKSSLDLVELPSEPLEPGEVRVRVAANGLNALDVSICKGTHPLRPAPPFVLGAELVGVVAETGPGVRTVRTGERVAGMSPSAFGCFGTEARIPEHGVLPVPEDIPDADAAALLVTYQAAHVALTRRARLAPEEWVLVSGGSGALGTAITQLAAALGGRVIAVASSEERRRACLDCGAVATLPTEAETLAERVLELTAGHGADVICDLLGGSFIASVASAAAFEGRLLSCGWASGSTPELDLSVLVRSNLTLGGVSWGASYPNLAPDVVRDTHVQILRMYRDGAIRPLIGQQGSQRELPDILEAMASRSTIGKSVVEWR